MKDSTRTVALGVLAIVFSIVISTHAMRLLLIADFQTSQISLAAFVDRFNARALVFFIVELALSVLCLIPPITSFLLFFEVFPIFAYELHLLARKRLHIRATRAIRSLRRLKIEGGIKIIALFIALLTCIFNIVFSG
jgi:hypothetical protein